MRTEVAKWGRLAAGGLKMPVVPPPPSSTLQKCMYHTIEAVRRNFIGNKVPAQARARGRIPGVVIAQQFLTKNPRDSAESRKHLFTTEEKQIQAILDSVGLRFFCSTTFPLQIRASARSSTLLDSGTVLPIRIQRNEETGQILNLMFVWADEGTELKVDVPLVFKGEDVCPGLKKGGSLNLIRPSLRYLCPAQHIPPKIEVDVTNLDIGDSVFIRDIKVHPSMKPLSKSEDVLICTMKATNPNPAVETKSAASDPVVTKSAEQDHLSQ